jgi:hypothetical protein
MAYLAQNGDLFGGSCEHGNEPSVSINGEEFLAQLSEQEQIFSFEKDLATRTIRITLRA